MRASIERTPRFAIRVFTDAEREYCESKGVAKFQSYAARFAAKEAFLKALKTGWRGKIAWHDIEIIVDGDGVPSISLTGESEKLLSSSGADVVHVSLSHTAEHAIAQVILERRID